jgi:pimeloyl-ACP methyl ester carboxylesterase
VIRLLSGARVLLQRRDRLGLETLLRRPRARRLLLRQAMERGDRAPAHDVAAMIDDALGCLAYAGFIDWIRTARPIGPAREPARYPIRIAWAEHDRTIPFGRYGRPFLDAVAHAEHVTVRGVGHIPMFDDPELVAGTILEITRQADEDRSEPSATRPTIAAAASRRL